MTACAAPSPSTRLPPMIEAAERELTRTWGPLLYEVEMAALAVEIEYGQGGVGTIPPALSRVVALPGPDLPERTAAAMMWSSNVVATPHIGSATHETREAMAKCAVDNLLAALAGERPKNLVNTGAWKR